MLRIEKAKDNRLSVSTWPPIQYSIPLINPISARWNDSLLCILCCLFFPSSFHQWSVTPIGPCLIFFFFMSNPLIEFLQAAAFSHRSISRHILASWLSPMYFLSLATFWLSYISGTLSSLMCFLSLAMFRLLFISSTPSSLVCFLSLAAFRLLSISSTSYFSYLICCTPCLSWIYYHLPLLDFCLLYQCRKWAT